MSRPVTGKTCLYCRGPIQSRGPKRDATVTYCSRDCLRAHEHERNKQAGRAPITKPCEECGNPFTYYTSMRPQAAYCSLTCKNKGHARKMTGRAPSKNSTDATWRKSVRRFFHDRCSICGWDEAPCDIAHIDARKNGGRNDVENATMLCPNHHRMYDCGLIPVEDIRAVRVKILRN